MMDLYLCHNPYIIETIFRIDDKACGERWFVDLTNGDGVPSRLQMWIGQFFDKLHEAYPGKKKLHLTYKGTSEDCRDVAEAARIAADRLGLEITVSEEPCGNPESKFEELRKLYEEAAKGPYEDFHAVELQDEFKRIEDRLLSVAVMAPMKNGKSTLLNAFLGRELLPNATQRCTAKISFIEHCKGLQVCEAKSIDKSEASSMYRPCDMETLKEWNADDGVRHVCIRASLPGMGGNECRLQFVDTPGPDSAVYKEDRTTIERFLNDNSLPMVCYIVDRINTTEESYLRRINDQMSRFGKQSEDRFLFIVSFMDQIDIRKGDSKGDNPIKKKIEEIRADLQRLGISNPRIFPISAKLALKAREYTALDEEDKEEAREDFKRFLRGLKRIDSTLLQYTSVGDAIRHKIETEMSDLRQKIENGTDELADNLRFAELSSGIPALEMAIEEYGQKYYVPARIYDAATIFDDGIKKANAEERLLKELDSHQTTLEAIGTSIEKLRHFLSQGEEVQAMRTTMFPEEWVESPLLKNDLKNSERDFDCRIREKLADWHPGSLDAKGTISPEDAQAFSQTFIDFMDGLSAEMLGVYANHVENDARDGFRKLEGDYEVHIKEILGEMPEDLREFFDKVSFVLEPNARMKIGTEKFITQITEEYIEHFRRRITMEKDGFWRAMWSHMPFTDTETDDTRVKQREIDRVKYSEFKLDAKKGASLLLQQGIEKAEAAAENHYRKLREHMLKQFDAIDGKLNDFKEQLERNLARKKDEEQERKKYAKVLTWVKAFQEKLGHVLDLEA